MRRNFLIEIEPGTYLDGSNGGDDWETTTNKKTAWHMKEVEATKRLWQVSKKYPTSKVITK